MKNIFGKYTIRPRPVFGKLSIKSVIVSIEGNIARKYLSRLFLTPKLLILITFGILKKWLLQSVQTYI